MGSGTTFKIYLPQLHEDTLLTKSESGLKPPNPPKGSETVLVVEDDEDLRSLICGVLTDCGYAILNAPNGTDALRILDVHPGRIDLLLTDVVMPKLGGRLLGEYFLAHRTHAKVLYISGYTDDAVVRQGILYDKVQFLQKPFTPLGLADKVRGVLDAD